MDIIVIICYFEIQGRLPFENNEPNSPNERLCKLYFMSLYTARNLIQIWNNGGYFTALLHSFPRSNRSINFAVYVLYISIHISYFLHPLIYVLPVLNYFSCNWRAPEVLRGERITHHSDSWSYGMTVWGMMSLTKPFGSVTLQDASILYFNSYFVEALYAKFTQSCYLDLLTIRKIYIAKYAHC